MSGTKERTGHCICGVVSFKAHEATHAVEACHCNTCRRWSGGPYMEINCGMNVSFEGAGNITVYDSSDWAERGFCQKCGTHLFYRLKETQDHLMAVGLFEESDDLTFESQVFIDQKPDYYNFSEKTETLTGAELFAKFAPPS